jgi:hypothetical protein
LAEYGDPYRLAEVRVDMTVSGAAVEYLASVELEQPW